MIMGNDQGRLQSLTSNVQTNWAPKSILEIEQIVLKSSGSLTFLKDEEVQPKIENVFEYTHWDLNDASGKIKPLVFSNGKNQEDVVKEIMELIKDGTKIIFLHGACGTGKSAIALNVARLLGKSSIIVPVKALQRQYEDDYTIKKSLYKNDGKKMKIAMMTGRENHDSLINPGVSCASPDLPENIKITEKNYPRLAQFYRDNPFVSGQEIPELKNLRRLSIAPSNPYWSPIVPSSYELNQLKDAKKIKYMGCDDREYTFYQRKMGCSYYDQYLAYKQADVIIFNAAKYKAELAIGRKPATEIEVIDEADEFLDGLFQQDEINLTRLASSLVSLAPDSLTSRQTIQKVTEFVRLEEQNKRAIGINEQEVFHIDMTNIANIFENLKKDKELESEILVDENSYANRALEIAEELEGGTTDTYLTYRKEEDNLFVKLVSTNLGPKIKDMLDKSKVLLFMSGTLHSPTVLEHIFGIKDFKIVEAETLQQGAIEICMTGKERDCKFSNFNSGNHSRADYLQALAKSVEKAKLPSLIHVHAFQDLPSEEEKVRLGGLTLVPSQERLREIQDEDRNGKIITQFKQGSISRLFTTKCSRGIDFPGEMCNSIIFTKYPNPNVSDTFWKILQKTHPKYYWEFYRDKAHREFLQRIYRAVRSVKDHVYILSPDLRVLDAVKNLQNGQLH